MTTAVSNEVNGVGATGQDVSGYPVYTFIGFITKNWSEYLKNKQKLMQILFLEKVVKIWLKLRKKGVLLYSPKISRNYELPAVCGIFILNKNEQKYISIFMS